MNKKINLSLKPNKLNKYCIKRETLFFMCPYNSYFPDRN